MWASGRQPDAFSIPKYARKVVSNKFSVCKNNCGICYMKQYFVSFTVDRT